MDAATLTRVERSLSELEETIAKLRQSLRYWQVLEIDYEGLKEEFQGLPDNASLEQSYQTARDFKAESVDENELRSLFDDKQKGHRRPSQVVNILSKRVDYVARNVSTTRKQLSEAENKRNALLLARNPEHQDDAALPLSEITEELNDEGKVISAKVQIPGQEAPRLMDVLRKAGVAGIDGDEKSNTPDDEIGHGHGNTPRPERTDELLQNSSQPINGEAQDRVEDMTDDSHSSQSSENLGPTNPDDNDEEAALRQEMLQYGFDEVGTIVAELDLHDSGNFSADEFDNEEDYLSDYDEDVDLYTDESEDEKGATKNPVISDRYRRQMEALSKKHGITDMKNLGPESGIGDIVKEQLGRPPPAEAARNAAIAREEAARDTTRRPDSHVPSTTEEPKKKKTVAFAPTLDIAQELAEPMMSKSSEIAANPIGDTVVERSSFQSIEPSAPSASSAPRPPQAKKTSRFKAARSITPQAPTLPPPMTFTSHSKNKKTPEGPPGRITSDVLIERSISDISPPTDPTDFDEEMHRHEVAVEYQKMRNRRIHEQGGYVRDEEEDGFVEGFMPDAVANEVIDKARKVSRFKAAKLKS